MAVLYHHWLNPACRFARVLLAEKRIPVDLKLEREWERRPAFLRLSPAGEVPVYVSDDGDIFAGMMALAEYLEETTPEPALLTGDARERFEIRRLVGWFHTKFGSEVSRILMTEKLFKQHMRMGAVDAAALRAAAHNLKIHMRYISFLTADTPYLAGNHFTMADAAAAAHLSVVDYFGSIHWPDWPEVKDWYSRLKSRRSIAALHADRIGGLVPPAHYHDIDF